MKRIWVFVPLVLIVVCSQSLAQERRTVELTIRPAKIVEPAEEYRLLPDPDEQIDCDAAALYEKAVESLPKERENKRISQWFEMPVDDLPVDEVEKELARFEDSLELIERAGKCRRNKGGMAEADTDQLSKYNMLGRVLCVKAKVEIARGRFSSAIACMRDGLWMAKSLGEGPIVIHGLVGIAIGGGMLSQVVEVFVQAPKSPSLHEALKELPRPLIDVNKAIELEFGPEDSEGTVERIRSLMNRLDRHVATLQCVEALRLHAAKYDGKFPNKLDEITEVEIPVEPVTGKAFTYRRSGSQAVLAAPVDGKLKAKDSVSYKLRLVEPRKTETRRARTQK